MAIPSPTIKPFHEIKLTLSAAEINFAGVLWDGFIKINNLTNRNCLKNSNTDCQMYESG